jgi:hypothetical protein
MRNLKIKEEREKEEKEGKEVSARVAVARFPLTVPH